MTHYYAFKWLPGEKIPAYDRTFGSKETADRWVALDPERRFYTVNTLPEEFFC